MANPTSTSKLRPNLGNLANKEAQYAEGAGYTKFWRQVDVGKFPGFTRSFKVILKYLHETIQGGGKGGSYPGFRTMAERSGTSPMTCQRAVKFFVKHGLLSFKAGNPALSNEYSLLKSPLFLFAPCTQIEHSPCTQIEHSPCTQIEHLRVTNIERLKVEEDAAASPAAGVVETGVRAGTMGGTGDGARTYLPPIALTPLPSTSKTPFNASGAPGASSDLSRADYVAPARQAASPKGTTEAYTVWNHLTTQAKEKLGMDVPDRASWDLKTLQNKIDTKGYGFDKMMLAVKTLTGQWASVKQQLKIKDGTTLWQVLLFRTDELLDPQQFIGKGANWASPDIAECARADAEKNRAETMANWARVKAKMALTKKV